MRISTLVLLLIADAEPAASVEVCSPIFVPGDSAIKWTEHPGCLVLAVTVRVVSLYVSFIPGSFRLSPDVFSRSQGMSA